MFDLSSAQGILRDGYNSIKGYVQMTDHGKEKWLGDVNKIHENGTTSSSNEDSDWVFVGGKRRTDIESDEVAKQRLEDLIIAQWKALASEEQHDEDFIKYNKEAHPTLKEFINARRAVFAERREAREIRQQEHNTCLGCRVKRKARIRELMEENGTTTSKVEEAPLCRRHRLYRGGNMS